MKKAQKVINEYFKIEKDDDGSSSEIIYNPPLLAESENIRVELRKEKNHPRPHIHVIKKGKGKFYDVSIALDNFTILAGSKNVKYFDRAEFKKIGEFLEENADSFKVIYENLKGEL